MNIAAFPWARKVASALQQYEQIPLLGNAPPFDWERFSALMASHFGMQQLTIAEKSRGWREAAELKSGLGEQLVVLPIHLSPLEGNVFWMMSRENVAKFTAWMLNGKSQAQALSSEILAEGFYRFLALETLNIASTQEPLQSFSMSLSEEESLDGDAFCIDVALAFEKRTCWGRLAITPKFHKHWVEHFSRVNPQALSAKAASGLEIQLGVQVGALQLQPQQWEDAEVGDFVLLERKSSDSHGEMRIASLNLGGSPLFQVKIQQGQLQILDAQFTHEEPMNTPHEETEDKAISLRDLPLNIVVELARLQMPLAKLLELAPGNTIELPIHPEQAVRLTVNGQLIGRAELVHLGETLGIRILEKG